MWIFLAVVLTSFVVVNAARAQANSCANIIVFGSYDQPSLTENSYGITAVGTFRIAGETNENKQPDFNLTIINCEKQDDVRGKQNVVCRMMKAMVWAEAEKPNIDNPNCSLHLDTAEYAMKELQRGILVGIEDSTSCYNSTLTIDKNAKRVYLSFTRTKYADNYDRIRSGTCGTPPRTQVLMNCTAWPRIRKQGAPPRYCDFSSSSDK